MRDNESGFTLIEFLIAVFILMVGMLGLLQVINLALEKNMESILRYEAIVLADDVMLEQRAKTFIDIASVAKAGKPRNIRGIFKSYSAIVTVTSPSANSKQINVEVSWKYRNAVKNLGVSSSVSQIQN
jgi:type IV pilus assembly protein PilV